jgi:peptidoglycan/xylan/chitin deacetylase (PgdA/CDA1 family)
MIKRSKGPFSVLPFFDHVKEDGMSYRMSYRMIFKVLLGGILLCGLALPLGVQAEEGANRISVPGIGSSPGRGAQGVVAVEGVANHDAFRKWQVDLLLAGEEATFLAYGEDPQVQPGLLTSLDTTRYPNGDHLLRLRVVHDGMNYDEYFTPLTIANPTNPDQSQPTPTPSTAQTSPTPTPTALPAAPPNGLFVEGGVLRGGVPVHGVATHPTFRKWQLDLLITGDQNRERFLALGEEPVTGRSLLTTLETADFPNGTHSLRLRVVHSNLNYDEYFRQITIHNPGNTLRVGPDLYPGEGADRVIYLTFDDGPHPPYTGQILETLARYNARATFFVLGRSAQAQPELIQAIHAGGHGIGNHSWSHRRLTGLSQESFDWEVVRTQEALAGYAAACLRPPYGATDASTYSHSARLGYAVVLWSIDPLDWRRPGAQTIANHVVSRAFPGAVVVLHDGGGDRSQTVAALEIILRELSGQGYRFAPYCR